LACRRVGRGGGILPQKDSAMSQPGFKVKTKMSFHYKKNKRKKSNRRGRKLSGQEKPGMPSDDSLLQSDVTAGDAAMGKKRMYNQSRKKRPLLHYEEKTTEGTALKSLKTHASKNHKKGDSGSPPEYKSTERTQKPKTARGITHQK